MAEGFVPPSDEQRGLYWIWIQEAAPQLEMSKKEIHEAMKGMFTKLPSTMDMHTLQFGEYMTSVRDWLTENGVELSV